MDIMRIARVMVGIDRIINLMTGITGVKTGIMRNMIGIIETEVIGTKGTTKIHKGTIEDMTEGIEMIAIGIEMIAIGIEMIAIGIEMIDIKIKMIDAEIEVIGTKRVAGTQGMRSEAKAQIVQEIQTELIAKDIEKCTPHDKYDNATICNL
jgi:hypothetical protein